MKQYNVTIAGSVFLMHNGRLSDPLDPYTKALKAVSAKKKKSDEDHEAVARAEWMGSLYIDDQVGPYVPGAMLQAVVIEGAKARKLGKDVARFVVVGSDVNKLEYQGPRTAEALYKSGKFTDRRGVRVQMARVMRTRPVFRDWSVSFTLQTLSDDINAEDIKMAVEDAGFRGIGDGRPVVAGRFNLVSFEEVK